MEIYDTILIGAGPAGLTAALYTGRYRMKTLLIYSMLGGTMTEAHKIWNFPSYDEISGFELTKKMYKQIKDLEIKTKMEIAIKIDRDKDYFKVITQKNTYFSKTIIITSGREKAKLNLKNENKFLGKGIHYCATCDASFYKDKIVGVVGGGNSAMNAAILLSKYAKKVYIIYRREKYARAEKILIEHISKDKKIESLFNSTITEILGKEKLSAVKINNKKILDLDGLFIEVGSLPNKEILKNLKLDFEKDFIKVNNNQETSIKGIFAAGDITNNSLKQIITACGEGAIAAYSAYNYINN